MFFLVLFPRICAFPPFFLFYSSGGFQVFQALPAFLAISVVFERPQRALFSQPALSDGLAGPRRSVGLARELVVLAKRRGKADGGRVRQKWRRTSREQLADGILWEIHLNHLEQSLGAVQQPALCSRSKAFCGSLLGGLGMLLRCLFACRGGK